MRLGYTITIPSVNKKPGEETPTRLRRTRPAEKIMMIIFWDKYGILLTKYLPCKTTTIGHHYAFILERRSGKAVVLVDGNAPIYE